jgi:hypothetical protein
MARESDAASRRLSDAARAIRARLDRAFGALSRETLFDEFVLGRGYDPDAFRAALAELEAAGQLRQTLRTLAPTRPAHVPGVPARNSLGPHTSLPEGAS